MKCLEMDYNMVGMDLESQLKINLIPVLWRLGIYPKMEGYQVTSWRIVKRLSRIVIKHSFVEEMMFPSLTSPQVRRLGVIMKRTKILPYDHTYFLYT